MKRQILEILDKSTSNGMKAKEIIGLIQMGIVQAQYDMLEKQLNSRDTPSTTATDWAVAMIENRLFGEV